MLDMTWVIGGIIPFGYGVGISDIRVTFSDDSHEDCLQKIHPIAHFMVAGFAGSVKIGFCLLQDLKIFLKLEEPGQAWIPEWVAMKWWRRARRIFNSFPEEERKLKSSILMIGIHPTKNNGDSPWPLGSVYIFDSPSFAPKAAKEMEFLSIGSGKYVDEYKKALHRATQLHDNPLIHAESGSIGGWGHAIKIGLSFTMKDHPDSTVSPHLHIVIIERGRLSIGNNNHTTYIKDAPQKFEMPWVAKSYPEFIKFCKDKKMNGALATC